MPVKDVQTKTISCDNPSGDCTKSVTFNVAEAQQMKENPSNVWLKSLRLIQTPDGRVLSYCSDVCEIQGARSGQHNTPEPKKIIEASDPAAIAQAAAAADAAKTSDANLRSGSGGPVIVEG